LKKLLNFIKKYEKIRFFGILKVTEDFSTDPYPDPLVRGTDPVLDPSIIKQK